MLTVLSVEDKICKGSFFRRFFVNSLKVRVHQSDEFEIRYLEYICRNGKVNWHKISKKAGEGRAELVYGGKETVPKDSGITLFEPTELRTRLCSNMALEVLELMKEIPKNLRVGLYDPQGEHSDLCERLLEYTCDFTVVTHNKAFYTQQAKILLEEKGVVLRVCSKVAALSRCGLIISPAPVREPFVPMTKAVVLTSLRPSVSLPCRVYSRYSLSLPKEIETLRPRDVPAEIFGGALYSICSVYEIGSCVPFVCVSDTDTQTTLSLRKYFRECFGS